jgi:hypothetical protein
MPGPHRDEEKFKKRKPAGKRYFPYETKVKIKVILYTLPGMIPIFSLLVLIEDFFRARCNRFYWYFP